MIYTLIFLLLVFVFSCMKVSSYCSRQEEYRERSDLHL